jgi:hypothetical protein
MFIEFACLASFLNALSISMACLSLWSTTTFRSQLKDVKSCMCMDRAERSNHAATGNHIALLARDASVDDIR